jgi:hypothetical protein
MDIVIPIGLGSPDNWELKYHLRSLEKNCKLTFKPIILGEPGVSIPWIKEVVYVSTTRYYPENLEGEYHAKLFENFFSVLYKVKCYADNHPEKFILAYDDQILLNSIESFDMFENVAFCRENVRKLINGGSRHDKTICEALRIAHLHKCRNGLSNYTNHAYKVYEGSKLQKLFGCYPLEKQKIPYELYTLYCNIFYDEPQSVIKDELNKLVAYLHWDDGSPHHAFATSPQEINEIAKNYTLLSYNDAGLRVAGSTLKTWIENEFSKPSKYEL